MTDLIAAVITLEAQAAGELDYFQGRAMHALFLDLTGRAEPDGPRRCTIATI